MSTTRFEISRGNKELTPEFRYITHAKYGADWSSVMHSHAITEMLYITGGKGSVLTRTGIFDVNCGDFLIIPPHFMHTEKSSPQQQMEYYVIGIENISYLEENMDDFNPIVPLSNSGEAVRSCIDQMYREIQKKDEGYEMMVKSLLLHLTVLLMRRKKIDIDIEKTDSIRSDIAALKTYIDGHYSENITLEKLAKMSFLSKYHLSREFRKEVGTSPICYMIEKRITESKSLLASTEMSISDISSSVGFSSSSYFSQRFKLITGTTPLDFRRASLGEKLLPSHKIVNKL